MIRNVLALFNRALDSSASRGRPRRELAIFLLLATAVLGLASTVSAQRTGLPTCDAGGGVRVYGCNGCNETSTNHECLECWDVDNSEWVHSCNGCQTTPSGGGATGGTCNWGSCSGECGGRSNGTCYCDEACVNMGDCCSNYRNTCSCDNSWVEQVVLGKGADKCGSSAADCYCDDACHAYGDCCGDKLNVCAAPDYCYCEMSGPHPLLTYNGGNPLYSGSDGPGEVQVNCGARGGCSGPGEGCADGYIPPACAYDGKEHMPGN